MLFTCQQQQLIDAINNVSRAVAVKSSIPVLEGIKLSLIEGSKLELTGYDLELGIVTSIDVITADTGSMVLNAKLFAEIIRKMPSDTISISVDDQMSVEIVSSSAQYRIVAQSADDYPDIPTIYKENAVAIPQNLLKNMVGQTIFAVSTNEAKPILTGELFNIKDNDFELVALDGYRLAVRKEKLSTSTPHYFVVPAKALSEVEKILSFEDTSECVIYQSTKHIIFEVNGYFVISRLLEGDFHDYKNSIPAEHSTEVILKTRLLIQSLERCLLLINDKIKAPVRCRFENDKVKISCSSQIGRLTDEFEADISGRMIEIGFNCRYLLDALKATESDKIRLYMNGDNRPMKIIPIDGDAYTFLVLPVRLKSEN